MKYLSEMHDLLFTVHDSHHDRDPCVLCDVIKAPFPFTYLVARAFRRDDQDELLRFIADLHHLIHQSRGFFPVDGNPAAVTEEPANRKAEQLRLAHKVDICPQAEYHAQEKEEVPVGGVRRTDQDKFWDVRQASVDMPAGQSHEGSGKIVIESAENGCVEN